MVAAGPRAAAEAEKARTRLLHEVDERRNSKTRATVNQLLDCYLGTLDVQPTTRARNMPPWAWLRDADGRSAYALWRYSQAAT